MNQTPPLPAPAPRAERPAAASGPAEVPSIDMAVLQTRLAESLDVLRDTYAPALGSGGGWYHELTRPEPGTTATALGLLAFAEAGRPFEYFDEGLALLTARQTSSGDALRDGGWATKTSLGMPVVEATGWIARFLARARCGLRDDAPDLGRAYLWLVRNQNADGGWGSLHGCQSRVWLTCLALRALSRLNPYAPAVDRGVEWLTADRTAHRPGRGPTQASRPTVTHTAFALVTLAEARPDLKTERLLDAYDWLLEHLDPGSGRTSLWTLWWRLEALIALTRIQPAGSAGMLHWLPDATVVQLAHARELPLAALLPHRRLFDPAALARRHWAALLLALVCAGSAFGVALGAWGWKDFWLSVILPVILTSIDESVKRRRPPRGPPPPGP